MREAGRPHLGDRQPAACQHHRIRREIAFVGGDAETGLAAGLWAVDIGNSVGEAQIDAHAIAFCHKHGDHRLRRAVAEQLAEGFFVPGDAVLVDQGDEIVLSIAGQRRFAEMRVAGQEIFRPGIEIREVAAPAARNQDLLARRVRVVEQQHAPPAGTGRHRAHHAGGARADDDDVEVFRISHIVAAVSGE
jgi:hypothetical protein